MAFMRRLFSELLKNVIDQVAFVVFFFWGGGRSPLPGSCTSFYDIDKWKKVRQMLMFAINVWLHIPATTRDGRTFLVDCQKL